MHSSLRLFGTWSAPGTFLVWYWAKCLSGEGRHKFWDLGRSHVDLPCSHYLFDREVESTKARGQCRQTYANRGVRQELAASTSGDVRRIWSVSCRRLFVPYPGGGKIRQDTKNQQQTVLDRVRGESLPPLPIYHISRNLRFRREPALRLGSRVLRGPCVLSYRGELALPSNPRGCRRSSVIHRVPAQGRRGVGPN